MRTYIQQPGQVGVQGGTIGNAGYLQEQERQRLRLNVSLNLNGTKMFSLRLNY
jgi:hypothetical protein